MELECRDSLGRAKEADRVTDRCLEVSPKAPAWKSMSRCGRSRETTGREVGAGPQDPEPAKG